MRIGTWAERRYVRRLKVHGSSRMSFWPFIDLASRRHKQSTAYDYFNWSHRREAFLAIARYCELNDVTSGYYFEFGCYLARTMRLAYDALGEAYNLTFVAFDSFEGLPAVTGIDIHGGLWFEGKMATSEQEFRRLCARHGIPSKRLLTVPGFYEESLTVELQESLLPQMASIIYIDCDLYLSTVPVLEFVRCFLRPGTLLVFDDWFLFFGDPMRGERRAFGEFTRKYPSMRFEPFISTHELKGFIYLGEA